MHIVRHLLATLARAFVRIVLTALACGALAAGLVVLVAAVWGHQWPPNQLTYVAMVAFALIGAYAGGLTILFGEALRSVFDLAGGVERDVANVARIVEHDLGRLG